MASPEAQNGKKQKYCSTIQSSGKSTTALYRAPSSTTKYYRVLQSTTQYYKVLHSTTEYYRVSGDNGTATHKNPATTAHGHTKVLQKYYKSTTKYYKVRVLQSTTKYYRLLQSTAIVLKRASRYRCVPKIASPENGDFF